MRFLRREQSARDMALDFADAIASEDDGCVRWRRSPFIRLARRWPILVKMMIAGAQRPIKRSFQSEICEQRRGARQLRPVAWPPPALFCHDYRPLNARRKSRPSSALAYRDS